MTLAISPPLAFSATLPQSARQTFRRGTTLENDPCPLIVQKLAVSR